MYKKNNIKSNNQNKYNTYVNNYTTQIIKNNLYKLNYL